MSDSSLPAVEVSSTPLERFEEFLQSRGKRVTQQRRALVEHVFRRHEHFDADDLIDEVSKSKSPERISRPTVYRTLKELVDAGLLRQMNINGRAVYEHDYGYPQHDHMHCEKCDKLIEFSSDDIQSLLQEIGLEHGFRISGRRLIVNGVCKECSQTSRRRKRPLDLI
ncbi:MAG: transcriptional repressor [Planctomycetales bacterium]|nr:transcriptional repressor [Planctomycetales bacterium]